MSLVRVHNFGLSLDGFGTGEPQTREAPFGHGFGIMEWMLSTRSFNELQGRHGGEMGVDDAFVSRSGPGIGAEIMGRNKFGFQRGPWKDEDWKGWWGDNPPFHTPVFVLSHHPRPSFELGDTTFHFIDATPEEALAMAKDAAGDLDVRIGGGATTVRQFLEADLIDYLHVTVTPVVLGRGVRLWDGLEGMHERFEVQTVVAPSGVVHYSFTKR